MIEKTLPLTDLEIAATAEMRPISEIPEKSGMDVDHEGNAMGLI